MSEAEPASRSDRCSDDKWTRNLTITYIDQKGSRNA